MKKKITLQMILSILLIICQIVFIIVRIIYGNLDDTFANLWSIIRYYIPGVVGIITLIMEINEVKKASDKVVATKETTPKKVTSKKVKK